MEIMEEMTDDDEEEEDEKSMSVRELKQYLLILEPVQLSDCYHRLLLLFPAQMHPYRPGSDGNTSVALSVLNSGKQREPVAFRLSPALEDLSCGGALKSHAATLRPCFVRPRLLLVLDTWGQ